MFPICLQIKKLYYLIEVINRAGVENVMNFLFKKELKSFFEEVGNFEQMITHSGIILFKYYLDLSKEEQEKRLKDRETNPLKQWKISPIDLKKLKSIGMITQKQGMKCF